MKIFKYIYIYTIISLMIFQCGSGEKKNIIGIYYKTFNTYNEKEIIKHLSKMAFNNNYTIITETYTKKPKLSVIKKFHRKKIKIIILENSNNSDIKKIAKYAYKKEILLSLITEKPIPYVPIQNIPDYKGLGYNIAFQLYQFTRRKRIKFIILFKNNYKDIFYKKQILLGYHKFFSSHPELNIITNTYNNTNSDMISKTLNRYIYNYTNNLRGILTDNDTMAVKMAYLLRRKGKDNEIKISGIDTSLEAVDSIMKTGMAVTGDINRFALFNTAILKAVTEYSNIMNTEKNQTNIIPGIYLNQINILDSLAKIKKFSIKQIIHNK